MYAGNRLADWPLHIVTVPTYYRPLRKCHVQEKWKGKRILPLHITYFANAQLWLDTEYSSSALYVHERV
jgi:hypothetical protein